MHVYMGSGERRRARQSGLCTHIALVPYPGVVFVSSSSSLSSDQPPSMPGGVANISP